MYTMYVYHVYHQKCIGEYFSYHVCAERQILHSDKKIAAKIYSFAIRRKAVTASLKIFEILLSIVNRVLDIDI